MRLLSLTKKRSLYFIVVKDQVQMRKKKRGREKEKENRKPRKGL